MGFALRSASGSTRMACPFAGGKLEIVKELAKAGSRNHRLLLRLQERGAILMGTESADLLVREYKLVKEIVAAGDSAEGHRAWRPGTGP